MTVAELTKELALSTFVMDDDAREVTGGYTGDLLSWVMGRAQADEAWVTIMSNNNIVAVASLTDVACVILAEGVCPDEGVSETAKQRGVNILGSALSAYELCGRIHALL